MRERSQRIEEDKSSQALGFFPSNLVVVFQFSLQYQFLPHHAGSPRTAPTGAGREVGFQGGMYIFYREPRHQKERSSSTNSTGISMHTASP